MLVQRNSDGKIRVSVRIENYLSVAEHVRDVTDAAVGLVDVTVSAETQYEESVYTIVDGWRDPTLAELVQLGQQKEQNQRHAREQLRQLRRDYPDLFDKQGRLKEDTVAS